MLFTKKIKQLIFVTKENSEVLHGDLNESEEDRIMKTIFCSIWKVQKYDQVRYWYAMLCTRKCLYYGI
jgi:hypothetical protein